MTKKHLIPKSKAKIAYDLLSEVSAAIVAEPKRYNQTKWLQRGRVGAYAIAPRGLPECGTVGCVAGWVVTLKGEKPSYDDVPVVAGRILQLDNEQRADLFYFAAAGDKPQTREHVRRGVKHIRAFQKTHAAQLKATRV